MGMKHLFYHMLSWFNRNGNESLLNLGEGSSKRNLIKILGAYRGESCHLIFLLLILLNVYRPILGPLLKQKSFQSSQKLEILCE